MEQLRTLRDTLGIVKAAMTASLTSHGGLLNNPCISDISIPYGLWESILANRRTLYSLRTLLKISTPAPQGRVDGDRYFRLIPDTLKLEKKLSVGDKVRKRNERDTGVVTRIFNNGKVQVTRDTPGLRKWNKQSEANFEIVESRFGPTSLSVGIELRCKLLNLNSD